MQFVRSPVCRDALIDIYDRFLVLGSETAPRGGVVFCLVFINTSPGLVCVVTTPFSEDSYSRPGRIRATTNEGSESGRFR